MDGAYKFTRLGFTAMMLSDFHMMLPLVTNLKEGDIFVAISTSGRTKDVLEMAQYAKRQGATVIAITKLIDHRRYIKRRIFVFVCQM